MLDPELFVIGGGVADTGDLVLEAARAAFRSELSARGYRPEASILLAELGHERAERIAESVGLAYDFGAEFTDATFVGHVVRVMGRRSTRCVVNVGAPVAAEASPHELAATLQRDVQRLVDDARAHWFATGQQRRP